MNSILSALRGQSAQSLKKRAKELKTKRCFGGKIDNFKDNRERHFYQRMLRAYLKGWTRFNFGNESHEVLVTYK